MSDPLRSVLAGPGLAGLDADERRLVCALREVPEGPFRADLLTTLDRLLAFGRNPHCALPCI